MKFQKNCALNKNQNQIKSVGVRLKTTRLDDRAGEPMVDEEDDDGGLIN